MNNVEASLHCSRRSFGGRFPVRARRVFSAKRQSRTASDCVERCADRFIGEADDKEPRQSESPPASLRESGSARKGQGRIGGGDGIRIAGEKPAERQANANSHRNADSDRFAGADIVGSRQSRAVRG